MERRILQQHNGFAILDEPGPNPSECLIDRHLEHLDVFALRCFPSASAGLVAARISSHEEVQTLRHRTWAHERIEDAPHVKNAEPGLFFCFGTNSFFWTGVIQHPRRRLDQHPAVPIHEGGVAKLTRKNHRALFEVVEQDGRPIAAVVLSRVSSCHVPSLIGAAAETYVLASAEKLGAASPYMVTNLNGVTGIITEKSVDDALLQPFVAAGLTLLRA